MDLYLYVPGFGMLEAIAEGLDRNAVNLAGKSRIQLTGKAYKLDLVNNQPGTYQFQTVPWSQSALAIIPGMPGG